MARCPKHDDKHPSLAIHLDERGFGNHHCKACTYRGDAYQFAVDFEIDPVPYAKGNIKNGKQTVGARKDKDIVYNLCNAAKEYSEMLGSEDSFLQYNLVGKDENGRLTFPYFNDNMEVIAIKHHKGKNGEAIHEKWDSIPAIGQWAKELPDKFDVCADDAHLTETKKALNNAKPFEPEIIIEEEGEILTMSEFLKRDYPEQKMIVQHMVQEGQLTIIGGDSGIGKSWITLELALAIANGKPVFNYFEVDKPRKVLLFQFELTPSQVQKRLKALIPNFEVNDNFNLKVYKKRKTFKDRWTEIENNLSTRKYDGGVVIVDNLYTSLDADKDPSSNKDLQATLDKMTQIMDTYNVALAVVTHHFKGVKEKPINVDHLLGGKFLHMNASYVFQVKQSRLSVDLRVAMITKVRDEYCNLYDIPWKLHWNPENHTWTKGEIIPKEEIHYIETSKRWEVELIKEMKSYEGTGNNVPIGGEWQREDIWRFLETKDWVRNSSTDVKVSRFLKRVCDWGIMKNVGYNKYHIVESDLTARV